MRGRLRADVATFINDYADCGVPYDILVYPTMLCTKSQLTSGFHKAIIQIRHTSVRRSQKQITAQRRTLFQGMRPTSGRLSHSTPFRNIQLKGDL